LIALALEPEWEARFSPGSYGFRKGRSAHDALSCIRASIQFKPKWVLDADIEKFFDRVNHAALLRKLETYPAMRTAIRRILKSGVLAGKEMTYPEEGTPQGGPLSPLLANIVLHGIETELRTLSQDWKSSKHRPVVMVRYADDFVVLHEDKEVIQKCGQFIAEWLRPMGLGLHATKTRIVHTLQEEAGAVGFDFLGHHIRQFQTGKYAVKPCFNRVHTSIKPSSKSQLRVYERLTETIEKTMCLQALPPDARVRILISRLNSIIRGWCNYFRCSNAKDTFTKLDYLLWRKLWKVLRRLYRKKSRHWIVERYLKDEENHWSFQCPVADSNHRHQLIRFADTKVKRHYPTRHDQNYFNGDWAYWATRMGRYPGLPRWIGNLLQKQAGKCHHCRVRIHSDHAVARQPARIGKKGAICLVLLHNDCVAEFRQKASQSILAADTVCSPVR
jgi:RNA-directed DNA polymerase